LHDVARFVHEKSFAEMFRLGVTMGDMRGASYQLDVFIPIDLYMIDLGEGLEPGVTSSHVKPSQVRSVPLRALLRGMLDKRIQRFGAKPMDARGLLGIMMRHATTNPEQERTFQDPSYALISDHYLNYTARVGYHFGVVDTYCGKTANKNYITLQFRGGAADYVRRCRRSRAVGEILKEFGFLVEVKEDSVDASLSKSTQDETAGQLEMVGRLLQYVRQMDVAMVSEEAADRLRDGFLRGDYDSAMG
jgi:pyruvate,water dikinase